MKVKIEEITPAKAKKMLQLNHSNRRINRNHVTFLAKEMTEGRWKLNNASIGLNGDRLLDGQHRLLAVIAANNPIRAVVCRDMDANVFDTIDSGGKGRSAGDLLGILGERNVNVLAGALNFMLQYEAGSIMLRRPFKPTMVQNALKAHPDMRRSANLAVAPIKNLVPGSVFAALHYLFSKKDSALADTIAQQLFDGMGSSPRDPIQLFIKRMQDNRASVQKMHRNTQAALLIKAWNLRRKNRTVQRLWWDPAKEQFPEIA